MFLRLKGLLINLSDFLTKITSMVHYFIHSFKLASMFFFSTFARFFVVGEGGG